jgi:hypothetical protein
MAGQECERSMELREVDQMLGESVWQAKRCRPRLEAGRVIRVDASECSVFGGRVPRVVLW